MKNKQKSRSGCRKCKEKRLKCDEAQPACANCIRRGLACPGYQQRLQWSTKYERRPSFAPNGPTNFTQLASAASNSIAMVPELQPRDEVASALGSPVVGSAGPSARASPAATDSEEDATTTSDPDAKIRPLGKATLPARRAAHAARSSDLVLAPSLVDIPTFLIDHWFKSVCHSWSAYDSESNPYRQLTSSLWTRSGSVYWALQTISAASLVERLPHVITDIAMSAPRMAEEAIQKELVLFSSGTVDKFPSELLVSLFCMSSSLCWTESRQLGLRFVRQARAVLKCLDKKALNEDDQALLDFFNGCLIYEEMLRSVVSDDEVDTKNMLSWPEPGNRDTIMPLDPHAWTGVSPHILRLFGKAMALCRRSRNRWRLHSTTTYKILQGAMMDIEEARSVEESLLATEPLRPSATPDVKPSDRADVQHFYNVTEAYRLSSLLQLYLTFPDLVANRIPSQVDEDGSVGWDAWVSPLALHIADVLEKIPPASMRCIQPLLCLCAGSGLRFDSRPSFKYETYVEDLPPPPSGLPGDNPDSFTAGAEISETSLKILRARNFLIRRLEQLELSLPPKPISVANELLRAVWKVYDEEIGSSKRTHWVDVMTSTGLQSLFG